MSEFESMADPVEEGLAANPQVGEGTPTTAPERHPFYGSLTPSEEDNDMAVDPTPVSTAPEPVDVKPNKAIAAFVLLLANTLVAWLTTDHINADEFVAAAANIVVPFVVWAVSNRGRLFGG
jgi:hypothetical protein